MNTIVIYHSADFDGIACREVAKAYFGICPVTFLGWDYGDPVPEVHPGVIVYMLDVSIDQLMTHPNLTWIDHHKTAIEKYDTDANNIRGYRVDGVAACRLAYQWFFGTFAQFNLPLPCKQDYVDRKVNEPYAIQLLGEYDVWDRRDPDADTFQYGLKAQSYIDWTTLVTKKQSSLILSYLSDGSAAKRYMETIKSGFYAKRSFTLKFEGLTFCAMNLIAGNSTSFDHAVKPEHEALMMFYYDGTKFNFSLYHRAGKEDIDLSAIAKKYGGGGHKGACGFKMNASDFSLMMT